LLKEEIFFFLFAEMMMMMMVNGRGNPQMFSQVSMRMKTFSTLCQRLFSLSLGGMETSHSKKNLKRIKVQQRDRIKIENQLKHFFSSISG
jgi:hypothetical protein